MSFLFVWNSIIHGTPFILQSFHLWFRFFLTIKKVFFFSVRLILITLVVLGTMTSLWSFYFLASFWNLSMKVFPAHSWFVILYKFLFKILISLQLNLFPFFCISEFQWVMFDLLLCFLLYLFLILNDLFSFKLFLFLVLLRTICSWGILKIF